MYTVIPITTISEKCYQQLKEMAPVWAERLRTRDFYDSKTWTTYDEDEFYMSIDLRDRCIAGEACDWTRQYTDESHPLHEIAHEEGYCTDPCNYDVLVDMLISAYDELQDKC